jgi:predicted nucleic acid-binding protein
MQVFIDTGVLLRAFDRGSSAQKVILRALRKLWTQGHELATSHQNIAEFWNVATRPTSARGGFGLSGSEAEKRDDEHIRSLLVSIARAFPVGAVMLLETGGETKFKIRPVE